MALIAPSSAWVPLPGEDGSCDLHYVEQVAREIGRTMENDLIVVDKSTVPVGTADRVRAIITEELAARGKNFDFEVVSNPEFLKEGDAISDLMKPDRVVIGTSSDKAAATMRELYAPFARTRDKLIVMGIRSAEMTKYAANCMLATKNLLHQRDRHHLRACGRRRARRAQRHRF